MTFRSTLTAAAIGAAMIATAFAAPSQAAANLLVNGSFEDTALAPGAYFYPTAGTTVDGWYYYGSALADGQGPSPWWPEGSGFTGGDGDNFVALQTTSVIAQSFTLNAGGLDLSWLEGGRPASWGCCNGDQTYKVFLFNYDTNASIDVGQYATYSGQAFEQQTASIRDLAAGNYALVFQGLSANADQTAFIDNVSAIAAPEPVTWALMIVGFGGAGAMLRRRRALGLA